MKHLLFMVCAGILVTCLPACQKDDPPEEPKVEPAIVAPVLNGSWELREKSVAGIVTVYTFSPGNGDVLKFENGKYEKFEKGILTKKGAYTITADSTVSDNVCIVFQPGRFPNRVTYDNDLTKPKSFFEIKDGRLTFISGCYGYDAGHTETYVPLK